MTNEEFRNLGSSALAALSDEEFETLEARAAAERKAEWAAMLARSKDFDQLACEALLAADGE